MACTSTSLVAITVAFSMDAVVAVVIRFSAIVTLMATEPPIPRAAASAPARALVLIVEVSWASSLASRALIPVPVLRRKIVSAVWPI